MHLLLKERVVYRDVLKELFRPIGAVPGNMRRVKWNPKSYALLDYPIVKDGQVRVAVVFHAYYMQDLSYYFSHLSNISVKFDLLVTVPREEFRIIFQKELLKYNLNLDKVIICVSQNKGRNFAPFLIHFGKTLVKDYDLFLHIHTKQSAHSPHLKYWPNFLISNLLHSTELVNRIISVLSHSPNIGLAYPTTYAHLGHITDPWDGNISLARNTLKKLNFREFEEDFIFPAGGMFWANVNSLTELLNFDWKYEDFSDEDHIDPELFQIPYVIERLISVIPILKAFECIYLSSGQLTFDHSFASRTGILDRFWDRVFIRKLEH